MHSLPIFVRLDGRPVILIGIGPIAEAKRRLLEQAGAAVVGEDAPAQFAIVVDDDAAVARLKARGVLVNAVDRPDLCDFTLPAIVDRSPVIVAIGTGGASAGLAKALRQRLEFILPHGLGRLAEALCAARDRIRARWPDPSPRRLAIDDALLGPLNPLHDLPEDAVGQWLGGFVQQPTGTVVVPVYDSQLLDGKMVIDVPFWAVRSLGQADIVITPFELMPPLAALIRRDALIMAERPTDDPAGIVVEFVQAYG